MNPAHVLLKTYFKKMDAVGELSGVNDVIIGEAGSHFSGAKVKFFLKKKEKKIEAIQFKAYGSHYLIALSAYLTEYLQSKPLTDIEKLTFSDFILLFEIPVRFHHVARVVEEALKACLLEDNL